MKLTITTFGEDIFTLDVSEDIELENLKVLCEFETGVSPNNMNLIWNGQPLTDLKKTLRNYGIKEGEMILVQRIANTRNESSRPISDSEPLTQQTGLPTIDFSSIRVPGSARQANQSAGSSHGSFSENPAVIRDLLQNNPHELSLLKERNPALASALLSGSLEKFTEVLQSQQRERSDRELERIRMMNADPFDTSVQEKIAEEIRLKNVESNMETAMEFAPESFGQVVMLYIDCMVNGHAVKAFVDSGAQMTIMSQTCAERCNIMRLVDSRWAGIAKGVGTQKIIGRVHLCQIQIGDAFLQTSFSILEKQPMDMLLGLDMLKRHQCCIDLKNNRLDIGSSNTSTKFLAEGELPEHARLNAPISDSDTNLLDEDQQLASALHQSSKEDSAQNDASTSTNNLAVQQSDILKITVHGFSRQQAITELKNANGNIDQALAVLLARSLQGP